MGGLCPAIAGCRAAAVLGLGPAHWWVELGPGASGCRAWGSCSSVCALVCGQVLGPLVGRAVSRGGCRLRGSQASLSAGGWGSVHTQLVAWPEGSQYWCLQAGGQGGLGPEANELEDSTMEFAGSRVHVVEGAPQMAAPSVCVPRASASGLLPIREALQVQQVGLTQAPFKFRLLPWAL